MSAAAGGARSYPDELRRASRAGVLRILHLQGPASRAQLATALGVNRSTIKSIVDLLDDEGYVIQSVPVRAGGAGRPSTVVALRARSAWALAAEIGVGRLTVSAIGLGGGVLARRDDIALPPDVDPAVLVSLVRVMAAAVAREVGVAPLGLGIAVPGVVRARDGAVRRAANLGWSEVDLGAMVTQATGLAVHVRNDSDLGALAEHLRGCARDVSHLVYLVVDVGVGGGVIDAGSPIAGSGGYAGEIGHMVVRRRGRRCRCGARGCWETEIGESALVRAVGLDPGVGRAHLRRRLHLLRTGADPVPEALHDYGRRLAVGLGNLINLFDPQTVVFGGVLADVLPLLVDDVEAYLSRGRLIERSVSLRPSALGETGPLVGAAETVFAQFLEWA